MLTDIAHGMHTQGIAKPFQLKGGFEQLRAIDEGFVQVKDTKDADAFIANCRRVRLWDREGKVKMGK